MSPRGLAWATLALTLAWALSSPALLLAQDCGEGRERVDGRCCWPGQSFSVERGRCEGAPRCPTSLTEHGDDCVARAPEVAPAVAAAPTATPSASLGVPDGYGLSTAHWPAQGEEHPSRAVRSHGEDEGLIALAFSLFDSGWLLGWIVGMIDIGSADCGGFTGGGFAAMGCNSWPLTFIPLAGGITASLTRFGPSSRNSYVGMIFGIPSVILQGVGIIAAIVAFANSTDELGFRPIGDPQGVSLSFVPAAANSDVGASLDLRF